jgi:hypothetical protein
MKQVEQKKWEEKKKERKKENKWGKLKLNG